MRRGKVVPDRLSLCLLGALVLCLSPSVHAEVIGYQGYEASGDSWAFTTNPPEYNISGDVWDSVTTLSSINPYAGSRFWGMQDLDNPNGGGNFFHTNMLSALDVSAHNDVVLSFQYYTIGYEVGLDFMRYSVMYDNGTAWSGYVQLEEDTSGSWSNIIIAVPSTATYVRLSLEADQNGASDYAGWDAISLTGTPVGATAPSVTTRSVSNITTTTADGGGEVTADGGETVTNRGICWATSATPTISDTVTNSGTGTGEFNSTLTGLTPGDIYYVRAFAQNSVGTGYGSDQVFTAACFSAPVSSAATGVNDTEFTANWSSVSGADGYLLDVATNENFDAGGTSELIISEYIEGDAFNKYLEIFNGTDSSVSLSSYDIVLYYNGSTSVGATIDLTDGSNIAPGEVYILANTSATGWTGTPDQVNGGLGFNGNDVVALRKDSANIDVIGTIGSSAIFAQDTNLVRKSSVTAPTTTYDASEWNGQPYAYTNLGHHLAAADTFAAGYQGREVGDVTSAVVTGLTVGTVYYYRVRATNDGCVSGNSETQTVITAYDRGGVTQLGTTISTNGAIVINGLIGAGEYDVTNAVHNSNGIFTNMFLDTDYTNLFIGIQYSNISTIAWSVGADGCISSNGFGGGALDTTPEILTNGIDVTDFGSLNGDHVSTAGVSGLAIAVPDGWTSYDSSYFTNSLTISNGFRITLTNLSFQHRRYSADGPTNWQVGYSLDGAAYITLSNGTFIGTNYWYTNNIDMTSIGTIVGQSTLDFRYDAWGAVEGTTNLAAGGIAIIGYNLDLPEDFTIVVLNPFPEGTVIRFTDDGWLVPEQTFRTNEGHYTSWTSTAAAAAGDVITLDLYAMNADGDQWCAHQSDGATFTTFVYAVNAYHTNWQATAADSETSALYPGLVDGTTAVAVPYQNAYYTGTLSGTRAELLAAIGEPNNWTGSVDALTLPTNTFTITDAGDVVTNNVGWAVDNVFLQGNVDAGTGEDSINEAILIYIDTDASNNVAGVTNLTSLTAAGSWKETAATFSGPDGNANDPMWPLVVDGTYTGAFDADFVAVLIPGKTGADAVGFYGIDRSSPSTLSALSFSAVNNKANMTAEFGIPYSSLRGFSAAQAADLMTACAGDNIYIFAVVEFITNSVGTDQTVPDNDITASAGLLSYTNVGNLDMGPAFEEPTVRPTSCTITGAEIVAEVTWTGGDGAGSIVLVKQGSPVDETPVDGTIYTADSTYGAGDELGTSNFVCCITNGSSFLLYGLSTGHVYHVAVFEFNGQDDCADFLGSPRRSSYAPTLVVLYSFELTVEDDKVLVCWETSSEINTLGFWIYRQDGEGGWVRVNDELVFGTGIFNAGLGGSYCIEDPDAVPGQTYTYKLVEVEITGVENEYGPYERLAYALKLTSPIYPVDGGVAIRWLSRTSELYRVLRSTDLNYGFSILESQIQATPPVNVYTDTTSQAGSAFYRVEVNQ